MIILILKILAIILAVFFAAFLFAVTPRLSSTYKRRAVRFKGQYIAHRGLHSQDIKENTTKAFEAAVFSGYGIEFDVRVSSDGIPVISHDSSLKRVFGVDINIEDCRAEELAVYGVPTLAETLALVNGKVPLVVELKMDNASSRVCELTAPLLASYNGDYCIESFHPVALIRWRKLMPRDIRGQLSSLFSDAKKKGLRERVKFFILRNLLTNFLTRPDFIAYDFHGISNMSRKYCRVCGALSVAWTLRSPQELEFCKSQFDTYIFEGFTPKKRYII